MNDALDKQARELLDAALTATLLKKLGARLDGEETHALREAIVRLASARGVELEEEASTWPGKKLLRRAQGREAGARRRRNPIARDEGFSCVDCGEEVRAHGRTARDHCPSCLCSLHVDIVPGDRAASCGGVLRPVGVEMRGGHPYLLYRCGTCGEAKVNQAILDGEQPDSWERILKLSSRET
jgi:DNA-directed RNA polymerase subunit RPC12/RpoP